LSYWWNNRSEFNHIHKINWLYIIISILKKLHEQNMLKYISDDLIKTAFYNWWNYFNSWTEHKSVITDVWTWHLRLEHVRFQSFQHLVICFKNVWIWRKLKNSITIDCNNYAVSKILQKIHHEFKFNKKNSEKHLAIDFHNFKQNAENFTFLTIITDHWLDFIWDFYLSSHIAELVIKLLTFFFDFLKW